MTKIGRTLGTANALLAANYLGLTFTSYSYGPTSLSASARFVPPNKTIMMGISLDNPATGTMYIEHAGATEHLIFKNATGTAFEDGVGGAIMCDGSLAIRNADGSANDLKILGVTIP